MLGFPISIWKSQMSLTDLITCFNGSACLHSHWRPPARLEAPRLPCVLLQMFKAKVIRWHLIRASLSPPAQPHDTDYRYRTFGFMLLFILLKDGEASRHTMAPLGAIVYNIPVTMWKGSRRDILCSVLGLLAHATAICCLWVSCCWYLIICLRHR